MNIIYWNEFTLQLQIGYSQRRHSGNRKGSSMFHLVTMHNDMQNDMQDEMHNDLLDNFKA